MSLRANDPLTHSILTKMTLNAMLTFFKVHIEVNTFNRNVRALKAVNILSRFTNNNDLCARSVFVQFVKFTHTINALSIFWVELTASLGNVVAY